MAICLNLPMPPPVNGLYANVPGKGRVKTKRYKTWIKAANDAFLIQKREQQRIDGRFIAHIVLDENKWAGDVDNRAKAVLDRLVSLNLVDDDRHCRRVTTEWGEIDMEVENVPSDCRVFAWAAP